MNRATGLALVLLGLLLVAVGFHWASSGARKDPASSESAWQARTAPPVQWAERLERPGLPNLYRVSGDLYRGAQPDPKATGFEELRKLGVKTIVNLRSLHGEGDEVQEAGLAYERIQFNPLAAPQDDEVIRFLGVVTDPSRTPVFVHCKHGADRTGTMCAAYRIVVQGWSKEEAVKEMKDGDFGHHDELYASYRRYLMELDVEKIRQALASRKRY